MPRRLRLSLVLLALLLSALALLYWGQKRAHRRQLARAASTSVGVAPPPISVAPGPPIHLPVADAPDTTPLTAGLFEGRVLSSDTRRPIARAQLTFLHAGAALGVVADGQGSFRFVPPEPGRYDLQSITADGYAPFAPEFGHSPVELWARRGVRVSGLVLFLDPAAGAEKKTDPRGSGTISGLVLDEQERPQADALVSAYGGGAPVRVLSEADGRFTLDGLDRSEYALTATARGLAPASAEQVRTGTRDVVLRLRAGGSLRGVVREARSGRPLAAFTIVISRRRGAVERAHSRAVTVFDASGSYRVDGLPPGSYVATAVARDYAPAPEQLARIERAGDVADADFKLVAGGRVHGRVVERGTGRPLAGAHVELEGTADIGGVPLRTDSDTLADADGRFELGGLGSGLHSIFASASGHHNYIASRLSVEPGGDLGPISIELRPLAPGEEPRSEMTGIGIAIGANVDEIVIRGVFPGGGAADAGLRVGDAILAVDGQGVAQIGFVQSVQNIRGPEGTTVELLVRRASGGAPAPVMVVRKRING